MSTPILLEPQLSVPQIAEMIGVDEATVWRWIRDEKIGPVRKFGRRITRVPQSAVRKFLQERTV